MSKIRMACAAAAVMLSLPLAVSSASAAPIAPSLSLAAQLAQSSEGNLTQVQYRRYGGYGYRGGGAGAVIGGLAAGAIIGGAIAASRPAPYYYGPGYAPGPSYYPAPVVVEEPAYGGGDDVSYCMQRYRSYDPRSGTYLNNDGNRYPCP